jgi:hypothetical protein
VVEVSTKLGGAGAAFALASAVLLAPLFAFAGDERINPFGCPGEAEAISSGLSTAQVQAEIDKRLVAPEGESESKPLEAHRWCVVAELKRRIGAADTAEYYQKAITTNPDEPGYELWYGYYLRNVRGAKGPHVEQSERHYYAALSKLEEHQTSGTAQPFDEATRDWSQRGLIHLYQMDGQPILPGKFFKHEPNGLTAPGLFLSTIHSTSADTSDFFKSNATRNFVAETAFSEGPLRMNRKLSVEEKAQMVRAPLRYEMNNRLRFRQNAIGSIDLLHKYSLAKGAQISNFFLPTDPFTDVSVQELGAGYGRVVDIYPLFDLSLQGAYKRISRKGLVEFKTDESQDFNLFEATPSISRWFGSNKLSINGAYVYMDIATPVKEERGHTIRAINFDFAMYGPVLLPQIDKGTLSLRRQYTRGWHFYGGYFEDDQIWGIRRRDIYGGSSLKGIGAYDVTVQGTLLKGEVWPIDPRNTTKRFIDPTQSQAQLRSSVILSRRMIDEEVSPGTPTSGFTATSLVLVMPIHYDLSTFGDRDFENVRVGAEAWLKLLGTSLGGTTMLLTGGYDFQYFHRLNKPVHMAHLDLRVGW